MSTIWVGILLVTIFHNKLSLSAENVTMTKEEANSFLSFSKRTSSEEKYLEECFAEYCKLEEVFEDFGHTEEAYEKWNFYVCRRLYEGCKVSDCRGNAIGMESGKIPDEDIDASSFLEPSRLRSGKYAPEAGRLNNPNGSWCAGIPQKKVYLQIKLPTLYKVCAVATQGSPLAKEWVTTYRLLFSKDGITYKHYKEKITGEIITGNTNSNTMVKKQLKHPVIAQFIRFVPVTWHSVRPCMRVEVYGIPIGIKHS